MGRYSYIQPSSSEEYDIDLTSLLQAEDNLCADEAESSHNIVEPVQYPPQPKSDDGIPKTCYCGGEIVVATAYTSKDPGRRYFTFENADDGDCHVWKWWDVAVMEELRDYQRQLRELKDQANESDEKLVKVEKTVGELAKKKSGIANGYPLVVCVLLSVLFLICMVVMFKWVEEKDNVLTESLEELQKMKMRVDGEEAVGAGEARPIGVKAAKASIKRRKSGREEELEKIHGIMEMKDKISKRKVLERLLAKTDPLSEMETSLKLKLMSEML
ncbi:hypothetical protein F2Q70_00011129 [Brassica cretica]|uniref:Zinc finger GRF-type domain-containing protein n=1 Tax=Brassica cretica TaxID=69181 RepID=A0A8S9M6W5_BRACR|nr:hypothetical protein F2Q70_00011129 [Brassica cretica]